MPRGFFGIGVFQPKTKENIGTLWRSAYNFGADFIFLIGKRYRHQVSDTVKAYKSIPLYEYSTFEDFYKHLPRETRLVGIELDALSHKLTQNYKHFERCVYLLGSEDTGLPSNIIEKCHHILEIPNLNRCLNVAVAGSIIMFDRKSKNDSN